MPVIAPIIAVAASGWAVGAAVTAGTLFTTITAVSAVVGAVGVITKNKTLMTIGLVGAAVGGIGQWAQSAGAFGGTAATKAAETASGAVSKEAVGSIVKGMNASSASVGTQVASATPEIVVTAAKTAAPISQVLPTTAQAVATAVAQPGTTPEKTSAEKLADKRLEALQRIEDDASGANGFLGSFKTFAKDNGALLMLGGSTLSSLFEQPAPGSVERTRAETELLAAQALEKKTQLANMQAPLASFTPPAVQGYRGIDPITGRQVQYATRTAADPGLINTITGAPV